MSEIEALSIVIKCWKDALMTGIKWDVALSFVRSSFDAFHSV